MTRGLSTIYRAFIAGRSRGWVLSFAVLVPVAVVSYFYVEAKPIDSLVVLIPLALIAAAMVARLIFVARAHPHDWQAEVLLSAAALVIIVSAIGLTQAVSRGEHQSEVARRVAPILGYAQSLDSVASDSLMGSTVLPQEAPAMIYLRTAALEHSIANAGLPFGSPALNNLRRLGRNYSEAVAAQLALHRAGQNGAALDAAAGRVSSARAALFDAIRASAVDYGQRSIEIARRGRIAAVALIIVALIVLVILLVRFDRVTRTTNLAEERNRASHDSAARFRALVGGTPDILTVIDTETRIVAYPETVARILGLPEDHVVGLRLDSMLSQADGEGTLETLEALAERAGANETLDWVLRRTDGSTFDAEATVVNRLDDPLVQGFVLCVRDVSERKRLEAELKHQTFHDKLTGLPNRGLVSDRLAQALRRSARDEQAHALVMLDLDDFKALNDSLGHRTGDRLLQAVSGRLSEQTRAGDTLARVGGDGFAFLVEELGSEEDAMQCAQRMLDALVEPFMLGDGAHVVSGSVGVAISDGSGPGTALEQASEMLRCAELAMYEAKRQDGPSIERYEAHMHDAVTTRLAMRAELALALQREEFSLVYQPLVDIDGRTIKGYEALVRWIHPERGMVSPADFIPAAEESGLIVELGTWVLREACRQLVEWQPGWSDTRYMSVNVAGHQLQRADFPEIVAAALADSGLPPSQLLLEVTESSLIEDTDGSERRLAELRALGVRLAIDDFGTGYSSLSYLQRFDVDVLKVDKSFIDHLTEADAGPGRALVEAIVTMARSLGLTVVAEGIEEPEQVEVLVEMRCALGQGYHYSRPLPAGEVAAFELAPGPSAATARGTHAGGRAVLRT